jgi:hypothetical protein
LPYERPALKAVLQGSMDGDEFARRLDGAIAASNAARAEPRLIEAKPVEGSKPLGPSPAEVSAERMGKSFQPMRRRV